jgi:fructose-1,6-bisphosphatase/inositol monophosphatase family enzyme
VRKTVMPVALADRSCIVYMGTLVHNGHGSGTVANVKRIKVNTKTRKSKAEQSVEMLIIELDRIVRQREQIKKEMEMTFWRRRRLLDLAGWDQRL